AVGGGARRIVEAAAGLRIDQRLGGRVHAPLLGAGAVAREQLDLGAVGGAARRDVHALAGAAQRAVAGDAPALRRRAGAREQLDRRAVGGAAAGDVDALAGDAGVDRAGGAGPGAVDLELVDPRGGVAVVGRREAAQADEPRAARRDRMERAAGPRAADI